MMRKWTYILIIVSFLTSCESILSSKPAGTLSTKQMIDVLVDIHLTEAMLNVANDPTVRLNDTAQLRSRFAQVFTKHNVDPDDFNASLTYNLEHIDELDQIYVEVINRLTELEATLQPTPIERTTNSMLRKGSNNIWFKSLNKTSAPETILYFSPMKYPVEERVRYPEPLKQVLQ